MSQTEMVVTITATAKPGELVAICLRLQPASFTVSVSLSPVPPPPSWSSLMLMPLRPPPPPLLSPVPLKHFSASVAKSDDDRDNLSLVASALSTVLQWSHGSICLMMVVVVALKWSSLQPGDRATTTTTTITISSSKIYSASQLTSDYIKSAFVFSICHLDLSFSSAGEEGEQRCNLTPTVAKLSRQSPVVVRASMNGSSSSSSWPLPFLFQLTLSSNLATATVAAAVVVNEKSTDGFPSRSSINWEAH